MKLIKMFKTIAFATILTISAVEVQAHTIALGTVNSGTPGSVSIWLGTYDHYSQVTEGTLTLNGTTSSFNLFQTSLPTGLIEGSNYFYADIINGSGTAGSFNSTVNNYGKPVINWLGATLTGLNAGTYSYTIAGMSSANWTDVNSHQSNWTGTLTIPQSSITPVPEPGTLTLLSLGLAGLGFARRKKA